MITVQYIDEKKIERTFDEIIAEVRKNLSFIGKRNTNENGVSLYETLMMTDKDKHLAYEFAKIMCNQIQDRLGRFASVKEVREEEDTEETIEAEFGTVLTIYMRATSDVVEEYVADSAFMALVTFIVANWVEGYLPAESARYSEMSKIYLDNLGNQFFRKKAPTFPTQKQ